MNRIKRILTLGIAGIMSAAMLTSCGGEAKPTAAMQVSVCAGYVDEGKLQTFSDELFAAHPDWTEGETPVTVEPISMGSEELDGTAYGAAILQVSARAAGNELDVMICGGQDAARNTRSDLFYPLEEIFTEEEIAQFGDRLLSYETVDTDGNLDGGETPVCGVRIQNEILDEIYGTTEYGVFIVCSTTHLDQAKEVFLALAAQ